MKVAQPCGFAHVVVTSVSAHSSPLRWPCAVSFSSSRASSFVVSDSSLIVQWQQQRPWRLPTACWVVAARRNGLGSQGQRDSVVAAAPGMDNLEMEGLVRPVTDDPGGSVDSGL